MSNSTSPYASVVFLTKNGGAVFREALGAVLSQKTGFDFEVVVVDSGSTDGTLEFLKKQPVKLHSIPPESFNFGETRDLGFSLGQGEILITLSQDAVPEGTNWLQSLCKPFNDPTVAAVQGKEKPWTDRNIFFWNKSRLFYFTREIRRWYKLYQHIGMSFVNCAVRKAVWETNRLGRVEMSEDKVFQKMLATKGLQVLVANNAVVWHSHLYDRKSLIKRCMNEGMGLRKVGVIYSRYDMLLDMFHPMVWVALLYGLLTLQIRSSAELLFPFIRPISIYRGNNSIENYIN